MALIMNCALEGILAGLMVHDQPRPPLPGPTNPKNAPGWSFHVFDGLNLTNPSVDSRTCRPRARQILPQRTLAGTPASASTCCSRAGWETCRRLKLTVPLGWVSTDQAAKCTCTGRAWLPDGSTRPRVRPIAAQAAPALASQRRVRRLLALAMISRAGILGCASTRESHTSARASLTSASMG